MYTKTNIQANQFMTYLKFALRLIASLSISLSAAEPLPLMDLCRRAARLALGRERLQEIESLPLPQSLKNYLQYQWLTGAGPTEQRHESDHQEVEGWTDETHLFKKDADTEDGWKDVHTESATAQHPMDSYEEGWGWTDGGGPGLHVEDTTAPDSFGYSSCSFISFGFFKINYWWWAPIRVSPSSGRRW